MLNQFQNQAEQVNYTARVDGVQEVTKAEPCKHCGKSDWCYRLGDGVEVCKRGETASGWFVTKKTDREGTAYLAPEQPKKAVRPKSETEYVYTSRDGQPLVKVVRIDDGQGSKRIFQRHWDGEKWINGLTDEVKQQIPMYRYQEVLEAVKAGDAIFIVEGEGVADALWNLNIAATTFIGGSGKYRSYGTYKEDLKDAKIVLCPDRDLPGLKHMEDINKDFPDAQWLYVYSDNDFYWKNLPNSGGLDIGDWVQEGATKEQIMNAVGEYNLSFGTSGGESNLSPDLEQKAKTLNLECLALLREKDSTIRLLKIKELSERYKLKVFEIQALLRDLKIKTTIPAVELETLRDIYASQDKLDYLVPGLIPVGETIILGGASKAGKTLLAVDIAFAVATGESKVLGVQAKRGKVLIICPDSSRNSIRKRLEIRAFREDTDNDNIRKIQKWHVSQMDELEEVLETWRPNLVIIDSLKRVSVGSSISENSSEFADNVYLISETLNKYGASGLVLHHTSQSTELVGIEKLRGSGGIPAAAWGTWILENIPVQDPNNKKKWIIDPRDMRRTLSIYPKDFEGETMLLNFNPENNSFEIVQQPEDVEKVTLEGKVKSLLSKHPDGLSGVEIIKNLSCGKSIYTILNRLEANEYVKRVPSPINRRTNLYMLLDNQQSTSNPPPSSSFQNVDYSPQSVAAQGLNNSQQDSQQSTENSQHSNLLTIDVDFLNPCTAKISDNSQQNTENNRGGGSKNSDINSTESELSSSNLVHTRNQLLKDSAPNLKPSEPQISNKTPRTAPHPDNAAREASKTDSSEALATETLFNVGDYHQCREDGFISRHDPHWDEIMKT